MLETCLPLQRYSLTAPCWWFHQCNLVQKSSNAPFYTWCTSQSCINVPLRTVNPTKEDSPRDEGGHWTRHLTAQTVCWQRYIHYSHSNLVTMVTMVTMVTIVIIAKLMPSFILPVHLRKQSMSRIWFPSSLLNNQTSFTSNTNYPIPFNQTIPLPRNK